MKDEYKTFIEQYCLNSMLKSADGSTGQMILTINYLDIDWHNLVLAEYLLENPEKLMDYTKQALEMMDLPAGISVDDINIRYENLPQPDFKMFCSE